VTGSLAASIERARRGDLAAFDEIVLAFHAPLLRFTGMVLGGDVHSAHDVVQDTFVALWTALPTLAEPRFVQAWLYRVAYRRAVSWMRRRGPGGRPFKGYSVEGEELAEPERGGPPRTWNVGGAWLPSAEAAPRLKAALGSLPAVYAAPLTLYYLEGLELPETARLLGLAVSTLKMRLHRAASCPHRVLTKEPWLPIRTRTRKPRPPPPAPVLAAETAALLAPVGGPPARGNPAGKLPRAVPPRARPPLGRRDPARRARNLRHREGPPVRRRPHLPRHPAARPPATVTPPAVPADRQPPTGRRRRTHLL
jgi:RNA polymerase sigma-70 factor (ECF subfamily)